MINISRDNFSVRVGTDDQVVHPVRIRRMRLVRRMSHYSDEDTQYTYSSTEGYTAEEDSAEDVQHDVYSDTSDIEDVQQNVNQDSDTSDIEDEQQIASNEGQVTEHMVSTSLDNAGTVENINNGKIYIFLKYFVFEELVASTTR